MTNDRVGASVGAGLMMLACLPAAGARAGMRTEGFAGPPAAGTAVAKAPEAAAAQAEPAQKIRSELRLAGKVLLIRGGDFVAEISGGAKAGDRLLFCREGFRPCSEGTVTRALDREVFLLKKTGGGAPDVGYRLTQTAAR